LPGNNAHVQSMITPAFSIITTAGRFEIAY
jgi:hypothetical protein